MDEETTGKMAQRVASAALKRGVRVKVAGEVRFIKDRGGDHMEWGWNPPTSNERNIDPDYQFKPKNLEPMARTLRSVLMALGHIQTARTTFTKIKSRNVSPDGNIGGKGYVMPIKDVRKQLSNSDEALSSIVDAIYDEINAVHWHPDVNDSGGNRRERDGVKDIMDDVEEIKDDPEDWAEGEEAEMDEEGGEGKMASAKVPADAEKVPGTKFWVSKAPSKGPIRGQKLQYKVYNEHGGVIGGSPDRAKAVEMAKKTASFTTSVMRVASLHLARKGA